MNEKRYDQTNGIMKTYLPYAERHRVVGGVRQKLCNKCEEWKDESRFYKRCTNRDGLAQTCKECSDKATNKCRSRRVKRKALSCMGLDQQYAS
jgi:hypothetical protein